MLKPSFSLLISYLFLCAGVHAKTTDYTYVDTRAFKAAKSAVNDPTRPAKARARDQNRKPLDILLFSGIKPHHKVLEIAPGEGYYTALLSRLIGDKGSLYAVDPKKAFEHLPRIKQFFINYQKVDPRKNVKYSVQNLDQIQIAEKVDQIWIVLYYHDTFWTGEDRQEMNRRLYNLLKPNGTLLVIDHHARPKDQDKVSRSLHRIHNSIVMTELTQAGFLLDSSSNILSNPNDPRTDSVFAPDRRGRSDRFVWRFKKPN